MEKVPFSEEGLQPEQLEREESLVLKSIDSVQEAMKEIDFKLIKEILHDMYKKVVPEMPDEELVSYLGLHEEFQIRVKYSEVRDSSRYGYKANLMGYPSARVLGDKITVFAREQVDENGMMSQQDKLRLTRALIHEILHTKTHFVVEDDETMTSVDGIAYNKYDKEYTEGKEVASINGIPFMLINEGLTELITDAIFAEYLARSGIIKEYEKKKKWYQKSQNIDRYAAYISERMALMSLVDILAKETGIPEEKIYQAFAIEYLTGEDIMRDEILNECRDNPEVIAFLEKLKNNDPNVFPEYSPKDFDSFLDFMDERQLAHVQALVGRDYIGDTNQRRVLRKKWYNVRH